MFRAIGLILLLWYLSGQFQDSFVALDKAATASFNTIEAAATLSQQHMNP
ncbi:MAG: hypothetical protein LR017_00205 [Candidatus Pacebacteria bacterium]|nr:hypothetical protein [Candidatus Paceibacterota bacterium]